jgi:Ca2+-binding EF-hand superfamily protein
VLDVIEIGPAVTACLNAKQLDKLVDFFDVDKDGKIDYDEFMRFAMEGVQVKAKSTGDVDIDRILKALQSEILDRAKINNGQFDLNKAFGLFDGDRDGWVTDKEFNKSLDVLNMGPILDKENREKLLEHFDRDGNGEIDYREFCEFAMGMGGGVKRTSTGDSALDLAVQKLQEKVKERAKLQGGVFDFTMPFRLFDENGDGVLSKNEVRQALIIMGLGGILTEDHLDKLYGIMDTNGDGGLAYDEFIDFVFKSDFGGGAGDGG